MAASTTACFIMPCRSAAVYLSALCAFVHTGPNLKAEHKVPWGFWLPNPAISKSDGILIELFGEVFCACYEHKMQHARLLEFCFHS